MSSAFFKVRARAIRYIGIRCYNEKDQRISCPISRTKLIAITVVVGLFVIVCLALLIITKCSSCSCRRRRRSTLAMHDHYATSPEAAPPEYRQCESSTKRPVLPTILASMQVDHSSLVQPTRPNDYLVPPSTKTIIEPAKIHPAVHLYPHS
ncbi:hypothetical protein MVEN_00075200 [Mycena venus]|uniref:Uncharacterized protein n=1 Tax=Mycena venus TaxID=2733690 RepID=A0A8H7DI31_9AGAR|nr:hypothetical protein MVEN_00075200 [Mycena venus]